MDEIINTNIYNLEVIKRNIFKNELGEVCKHMSVLDKEYTQFGEVYYSINYPDVIKGWKFHTHKLQNFVVISGKIKFVFYDDRINSPTKGEFFEVELSRDNYCLIKVPPQIWYSFSCTSETEGIIANFTDLPHDPEEALTKDLNSSEIPYKWN